MNIVSLGVRKVYYAVVQGPDGVQREIALEPEGYMALEQMMVPGQAESDLRTYMSQPGEVQEQAAALDLLQHLETGGNGESTPEPVEEMPDDLADKLKAVGIFDESPDPGEVYQDASADVEDQEQL